MSTLRNKVQLIGNLGNAPEIITLESGKKLAKFSIATNETYKNAKGEKVTDTQWTNIVAWNKTADIVEKYLKKEIKLQLKASLPQDRMMIKTATKDILPRWCVTSC